MEWSRYQSDIFDFVEHGEGNGIIEAVAGSGKTTTLVEAIRRVPEGASTIFLAFNKAIAEELKGRGVNARTFHSLTYSLTLRYMGASTVTTNKLDKILKAEFGFEKRKMYGTFIKKLVGLAKQMGIGCLVEDTKQRWAHLVEHHGLYIESNDANEDTAIELAQSLLRLSNESEMVDFDDMLYMPIKENLFLPTFDFIFVDEAQDTNPIQRALLERIMKPSSRVIAVGDSGQAIYGFRGADSNSMQLIEKGFNCTEFELSVSYRCGTSVINYANQWVPRILPRAGAHEGAVFDLGDEWEYDIFNPNDIVVCRTTQPLVSLAFRLLRQGIPATVVGREIGTGLKGLIKRLKANSLDDLEGRLIRWLEGEKKRALDRDNEALAEAQSDRVWCITFLMNDLRVYNGASTVDDLLESIDFLFSNKEREIKLMTIHKSKGLEADRVFWLDRDSCPLKWAKKDWEQQQEANLCYVATTRARNELVMIAPKTESV